MLIVQVKENCVNDVLGKFTVGKEYEVVGDIIQPRGGETHPSVVVIDDEGVLAIIGASQVVATLKKPEILTATLLSTEEPEKKVEPTLEDFSRTVTAPVVEKPTDEEMQKRVDALKKDVGKGAKKD